MKNTAEIEFQYRTLWDRVGAYFLDFALLIPLIIGVDFLLMQNQEEGPQFITDVLCSLTWALYMIIAQGLFGTTLGKKILNLKVQKLGEAGPIGLKKAFIREAIWIVPYLIIFLVYLLFNDPVKSISFKESLNYNWYIIIVGTIGSVLKIVTIARDPKRRGIHDKWSGSVVVRKLL